MISISIKLSRKLMIWAYSSLTQPL